MMKHWIWIGVGIVALLLVSAGIWGYGYIRRVDGRSPVQWLAYADQASQMVAYHAEGHSLTKGTPATFILDQGTDGRYVLTTWDAQGRRCSLGYDGSQVWYSTKTKQEKIMVSQTPETPMPDRALILGTAIIADRPVVRLAVSNGHAEKILAIDRHTGIVLALTTRAQRQVLNDMQFDYIAYRTVNVPSCTRVWRACQDRGPGNT